MLPSLSAHPPLHALALSASLLLATGCSSPQTSSTSGQATTDAVLSAVIPTPSAAPTPSSSVTAAAAPASTPCASASAPPDDSIDNPWCAPVATTAYGAWRPKPTEVLSALAAIKDLGGARGWLAGMAEDCMQRLAQPYFEVMRGVMGGDRFTKYAVTYATSSVEWSGRRFITVRSSARVDGAYTFTMDAVELTPAGPIQVIETCQEDPMSGAGPSGPRVAPPRGWATFPADVKKKLCP